MNNLKLTIITLVALLSMPFAAAAMDDHAHGSHDNEKTTETNHHREMMHNDQEGIKSDGSMIILGNSVSKGIRGMAHLKDVSVTMTKMGMLSTHHFMIAFIDEATGRQIETGKVALKITNPDAKVGETIEMVGMDGHFGADIILDMPGEYHFKLGTKLTDGENRKYHFHYINK